ncbi:dual-specificity phosphatase 28 [Plakobranchus ocellatus]|uniref:protein-tyrosine-phosphatase n=1 Tax=Plakobranchus ocellatus TaxID=259542 RepID=A0AAV3ZXG5_9GAST|nr:dual-specificity phosphatase 28 [Plakobranchus ocellatus]
MPTHNKLSRSLPRGMKHLALPLPPPQSSISQITDQVFLAGLRGVNRVDLVRAAGITHVLNLAADECPNLIYNFYSGSDACAAAGVSPPTMHSGKQGGSSARRKPSQDAPAQSKTKSGRKQVISSGDLSLAQNPPPMVNSASNGMSRTIVDTGVLRADSGGPLQPASPTTDFPESDTSSAAYGRKEPQSVVVRRAALRDSPEQILLPYLDDFVDFVAQAVRAGGRVLVHCSAGISRSASVVIAYLVREQAMSLKDAYDHVKSRREVTNPNPGFRAALERYEHIVQMRSLSKST